MEILSFKFYKKIDGELVYISICKFEDGRGVITKASEYFEKYGCPIVAKRA